MEEVGFVRKTVSIKPEQDKFIEKYHIQLSSLTQEAIDKLMEKFKKSD